MKKKIVAGLAIVCAMVTLVGCGYDDKSTDLAKIDCSKYITEVGDYKNAVLYADKSEVTDAVVEDYMNYILENKGNAITEEVTDRALQNGDIANIDFLGKKDGVAFQGGEGKGYDLTIGSGQFIPGFEEALIGMEIGETRDIDVTFPENYQSADLAGQPAVFTVTLNSISAKKLPELTDESIAGLNYEGISTVEEFRNYTRDVLEKSAEQNYQRDLQSGAMNYIYDNSKFAEEVPEGLYNYYHEMLVNSDTQQAQQAGVDLETFVTGYYQFESIDAYYEEMEKSAKKSVIEALLAYKIAETEGILFTDKDVEQSIQDNFADYGFASVDDFKKNMEVNDYKAYLIQEKVYQYIIDNAQIKPTSEKPEE